MLFALISLIALGLVDSYFISFLGTNELAAIGFIIPISSIPQGLGIGLGMAVSSLTSVLIGANRISSAARLITNAFYLTALVSLITVVIFITQLSNIFQLIGADSVVLPYILDYMQTWIIAIPLMIITMVCTSCFRAIGDTSTSAQISILMTLMNIILNPLFIFGVGPFPEYGIQGAAIGTVLAVLISALVGLYKLGVKDKLILWALPRWADFKHSLKELLEIALPAMLSNSILPITAAILTTFVATFGNDAVAGYGVAIRIEGASMVILYALSTTLPMFIGQNIGADKPDRVFLAMRISFRFTMILQLVIYILLIIFALPIARLFSTEPLVQNTIQIFLWVVPISFGLNGIVFLINGAMNVLGKPRLALYINVLRLVLFYIPLAYIGGQWFGLSGLFAGVALGNCCTYAYASFLLNKTFKEQGIKAPE